ncbi:Phosphatase YidA [Chlamydia abortus]|nr:Phosphatase YidA [Chlamydia abortus]
MDKTIKLIVSDLDGTLLSEEHRVTESVLRAVNSFTAAGGLFTIATGRTAISARQTIEQLNLTLPMILCNGSVIADRHKVWQQATLAVKELIPFLLEADRQGLSVILFQETGMVTVRRTEDVARFEEKENVHCRQADLESSAWAESMVQKILVIGSMEKIRSLWENQPSELQEAYSTVQSEDDFFEVLPANQSKGRALQTLLGLLGIDRSEVMAIGNQMNDLDMLEYAGIGVAVANSHPELKSRADYVCSGSCGDGVVEAIETFCTKRMRSGKE